MSVAAAAHASHDVLPGWLLLVIYLTGFVITSRIVFTMGDGEPDDRLAAFAFGFLWPAVAAFAVLVGLVSLPTIGAKTKRDRQVRALEAEERKRRSAARTAELEAENERLRKLMGETGDAP